MNVNIESMIARVETSSSTRSKFELDLDAETRDALSEFVAWLVATEHKTTNTANSYKSYVAKALARPELDLTSDQKSAVRAFARFTQS